LSRRTLNSREVWVFLQKQPRIFNQSFHALARERH